MKILGTGACLPETVITNKKIEGFGHSNDKWIREKLGIRERRVTWSLSSEIGYKAALDAIKDAGLEPLDIDLIIVATSTPDRITPSTACIIQDKMGAYSAVAFDINAVCSGFVYALALASEMASFVNVLVIGVDTFSHITDWEDRNCVFFGDGAGAAVVNSEPWRSGLSYKLGADGRGRHAFETKKGGTFQMDGKAVYEAGTTLLPEAISKALDLADLTIKDISWMLPHQASINMLKDLAKKIGLPWKKVKTNMQKYGNTAAASIPILLHESKKDFKEGNYILCAAVGSGWTYGAIILEW